MVALQRWVMWPLMLWQPDQSENQMEILRDTHLIPIQLSNNCWQPYFWWSCTGKDCPVHHLSSGLRKAQYNMGTVAVLWNRLDCEVWLWCASLLIRPLMPVRVLQQGQFWISPKNGAEMGQFPKLTPVQQLYLWLSLGASNTTFIVTLVHQVAVTVEVLKPS